MSFTPEKITKQHILDAVEKIESKNIELEPSKRFDVIINSKPYPPKEVMRHAHELINGEYIWERSGGEPTNKYLIDLGFEIKRKSEAPSISQLITNNVWKLGCNWGSGKPSFYNFIKDKQIIIGVQDKKYSIGDLIVVTEGHQVNAIARINENPKSVTNNNSLKNSFDKLEIDYESQVNYADAEWYELDEDESFVYQLQQGICKVQSSDIRKKVIDLWNNRNLNSISLGSANKKDMQAKNIILYGPPGTGKTYNSIDKAVEITSLDRYISGNHKANKTIFDEMKKSGQIEFITFHQNYSYEDFMVGIKPNVTEGTEDLSFKKHFGIFYEIANRARDNYFNSLKDADTLTYENWVKNMFEDFQEHVESIIDKEGKYVLKNAVSIYSVEDDAFIYTGEKPEGGKWKNERLGMHYAPLILMFLANIQGRKDIKSLDNIPSLEKQHATYCFELIQKFREYLKKNKKEFVKTESKVEELRRYALIIDEINRANISKVFGELITLLEDDKRLGGENELKITLPNGEKEFSVPPNLYIIGTMNTADKSIALIDIALRRRFEFIGYYPEYNELNEEESTLLKKVNEAVFKEKKSADYLIGHAYFMKGQTIETVLQNKVVPLIMEYFSGKTDIVSKIFADTNWNVTYNTTNFIWDISLR